MSCPICQEPITQGKVTLKCSHELCVHCFTKWARRSNTCPCCRDEFAEPITEKSSSKEMNIDIARVLLLQHKSQLTGNESIAFQCALLVDRSRFEDKKNYLNYIIEKNISDMLSRVSLWYER